MHRSTSLPEPHRVVRNGRATLRFFRGDALDLLNLLPGGSVDAIVTSPPYNIGVKYRSYDDSLPRDEYLAWTARWVTVARRALRPEGSLFLNVGSKPSDPWGAMDVAQAIRPHLVLQNTIHWVKSVVIDSELAGRAAGLERDLAVGHYKPINSQRFLNDCHEFIFHFTPCGTTPLDRTSIGVPYQDASNATRWKSGASGIRCRGNTWFMPYDTIQSRDRERPHPATFPPLLAERCLRLHGLSRLSLVVDPFLGLGSTAVACARLGLDFIGIDLDEVYLEKAAERAAAERPVSTEPPGGRAGPARRDVRTAEDREEAEIELPLLPLFDHTEGTPEGT